MYKTKAITRRATTKKATIPPTIPPIRAPLEVLFAAAGMLLSASWTTEVEYTCPAALVVRVVNVVLPVGVPVGVDDGNGVVGIDVAGGIKVNNDGGKVVCPDDRTAHMPETTAVRTKHF